MTNEETSDHTATTSCGSIQPAAADTPQPVGRTRDERIARDIERGVMRLLRAHSIACVGQLMLPDGRRADVAGLTKDGLLLIVEIKSGLADFRADDKWHNYRAFADRFYFAVDASFPVKVLPPDTGLIIADRFGGTFEREADEHLLATARRKAMTLRFARSAAARLQETFDPELGRSALD